MAEIEFAAWMRLNRAKVKKREHYEVRPCKAVRGFMLRLPGIGWRLWFPTAIEAMTFGRRLASFYAAACHVYDSAGEKIG